MQTERQPVVVVMGAQRARALPRVAGTASDRRPFFAFASAAVLLLGLMLPRPSAA